METRTDVRCIRINKKKRSKSDAVEGFTGARKDGRSQESLPAPIAQLAFFPAGFALNYFPLGVLDRGVVSAADAQVM